MKEQFLEMIRAVVDFMSTHYDPYFGLPFLTAAVGLGVVEVVTDYFTKE